MVRQSMQPASKPTWKERVRQLKREVYALALAYRDPRTPWYARVFLLCLLGYAFSPIDLIPDFIPVLGLLDDMVLLPLGILLAIKLIPAQVLTECREQARERLEQNKPVSFTGALVIILVWLLCAGLLALLLYHLFF